MQCESFTEVAEIVEHMVRLANGATGSDESLENLTELTRTHETNFISQNGASPVSTKGNETESLQQHNLVRQNSVKDEIRETITSHISILH